MATASILPASTVAGAHLKEALGRGAARMHNALRDALAVKVGKLLHHMVVCTAQLR